MKMVVRNDFGDQDEFAMAVRHPLQGCLRAVAIGVVRVNDWLVVSSGVWACVTLGGCYWERIAITGRSSKPTRKPPSHLTRGATLPRPDGTTVPVRLREEMREVLRVAAVN